jgi:CheY-like chemotaxis protein
MMKSLMIESWQANRRNPDSGKSNQIRRLPVHYAMACPHPVRTRLTFPAVSSIVGVNTVPKSESITGIEFPNSIEPFMIKPASSLTLLANDDEEDVREVIQLALEDAGYWVYTAPEGMSGLRLCAEIHPQIDLTNIRMPAMNGLEALETVKMRPPEIEAIVATAFGEMDLAVRALQMDASDFIHKPIHITVCHLRPRIWTHPLPETGPANQEKEHSA